VLRLESVFYVVALLNLPKLWLALFFVKAVKSVSEMLVAARRIFGFIQELEARAPPEEGQSAHGVPLGPPCLVTASVCCFCAVLWH
jgi:hypothetical protein